MCRVTDMLEAIGHRVIKVRDLGHDVLVFSRYKLALLDEDADCGYVADELLGLVATSIAEDNVGWAGVVDDGWPTLH